MAFATRTELLKRLDWDLSADELTMADEGLEDATELVKAAGSQWWTDEAHPALAERIVLKATARWLRNPDGYITSRAGDETLTWDDGRAGDNEGVYLTPNEERVLAKLARPGGLQSVMVSAWRTKPDADFIPVPVSDGSTPFPYPVEW